MKRPWQWHKKHFRFHTQKLAEFIENEHLIVKAGLNFQTKTLKAKKGYGITYSDEFQNESEAALRVFMRHILCMISIAGSQSPIDIIRSQQN